MKSLPILFSAPMVRALLNGSKTQTRRVVKPQPTHFNLAGVPRRATATGGPSDVICCPYGQPGDQLWVREAWAARFFHHDFGSVAEHWNDLRGPLKKYRTQANLALVAFKADGHCLGGWVPSIHMPRWASRITLNIVSVRVERLQDISDADAWAEGIDAGEALSMGCTDGAAVASYSALWESINGPESWDANPWVWVIEFRRLTK